MARVLLGITDRLSARGQVVLSSVALVCLSLFLTAYSSKHPGVAQAGSMAAAELAAPFHSAAESLRGSVQGSLRGYVALWGVAAENAKLRGEVEQLRGEINSLGEAQRENARLRALLSFAQQSGIQGVAAAVIGSDPSGWVRGLLIDKGTLDGVALGSAVVTAKGVVGQVVAAGPGSARVLLITDLTSGVDAVVQESRVRGVAEGLGSEGLELSYITKEARIREGELVLTSGLDGVYPKGLVLGSVSAISPGGAGLFQLVRVEPAVDIQRVEEVLVVRGRALEPAATGGRP